MAPLELTARLCLAGGVGFDINCGVRLIRTNLTEAEVGPLREKLAQALFDHIPVGVGSQGIIPTTRDDLEMALEMGIDWSVREAYAWAEDKEHCEEYGRMLNADPSKVSQRAKKRGLPQMGTLGAGNHYAEIQVVDEVYDKVRRRIALPSAPGSVWQWQRGRGTGALRALAVGRAQDGHRSEGAGLHHDPFRVPGPGPPGAPRSCPLQSAPALMPVPSSRPSPARQVATDALVAMERAMARDGIQTNDRQLACARIDSDEGQDYLAAMACAANYAWVNRSSMTFLTRQAFAKVRAHGDERLRLCNAMPWGGSVGRKVWAGSHGAINGAADPGAGLQLHSGRPGHARHLRRQPQHRQD